MKLSGFTLLEVLIATAIFAVISAITFQGLQTSLDVQERVEGRARDLVEMQLVWTVLFQDFVNMTRRPVREENREEPYPAFDLEPADDGDCVVSFTRAGLPASASLPAGMQRIAYCVRDDNLYRLVWPVLDRASGVEPQESLLMEDIEDFIVETYPADFDPGAEREISDAAADDDAKTDAEVKTEVKTDADAAAKADADADAKSDAEAKADADAKADAGAKTDLVTRDRKHEELPVGVAVTIEARDQVFVRWFPGGEEYRLDLDEVAPDESQ